MDQFLALAAQNLLSPVVLFFLLGFGAALARSDLSIPEALAKGMALYLMLAIGFKGGSAVAATGVSAALVTTIVAGIVISFLVPLIGYWLLRFASSLDRTDRAALAAHYGSISVVTFVAATETLRVLGIDYEGWIVAVMAIMETPAIIAGLMLAGGRRGFSRSLAREVFLNGAVVLLIGSFAIGWITGERGEAMLAPFIVEPFRGVLCLFLLDMGLIAASRLQTVEGLKPGLFAFGIYMPLLAAAVAVPMVWLLGLSVGTATMFIVLAASASYIAVPAAMRLALPKANPAIYVTLSLAITFPFNIIFGIPLYYAVAEWVI